MQIDPIMQTTTFKLSQSLLNIVWKSDYNLRVKLVFVSFRIYQYHER